MLKREDDTEKNVELEEIKNKYNFQELFEKIVLNNKEEKSEK